MIGPEIITIFQIFSETAGTAYSSSDPGSDARPIYSLYVPDTYMRDPSMDPRDPWDPGILL